MLNDTENSVWVIRWMMVQLAKVVGRSWIDMRINTAFLNILNLRCYETSKWSCQKGRRT